MIPKVEMKISESIYKILFETSLYSSFPISPLVNSLSSVKLQAETDYPEDFIFCFDLQV